MTLLLLRRRKKFENDTNALCFAGVLERSDIEIRRAADLGDAFAQAKMPGQTRGEERFRWAEKSAAQGERDELGHCCRYGQGCEEDLERAKENFLVAAELGRMQCLNTALCLMKTTLNDLSGLKELLKTGCLATS
jgi:TPR repeat protein